jgi:type VI secretion system protein ImpG
MNREFWQLYERELQILYEQVGDYAATYKGVAERLGGLTEERMDPTLKGLLEGAAFMAARVQLKIKSEFSEFTTALLDQLLPNYLAPTPSSLLVQVTPQYDDTNLLKGLSFPAGSLMEAVYVERERRVACTYRLGAPLTVWPLRIERAEYFPGPAPLQALGLEVLQQTASGLRLQFLNRTSSPETDTPGVTPPGVPANRLALDRLPIHLRGSGGDIDALYEHFFARCRRITLRYEDKHGDPHFLPVPLTALQQLGFEESDELYPTDERHFAGFELLRDYFAFPPKFAGFRLEGLRPILRQVDATAFDLLFEFDTAVTRLAPVVNATMFALYAAPAINLFERQCSRIPIRPAEYEHQIVPDRSRWLDFEPHRVVDVFAHYEGRTEKVPVYPLYSLPPINVRLEDALFYTVRRLPRLQSAHERRLGSQTRYAGTELFLQLYEPAGLSDVDRVKELSVRALCSNRALTEQLPVGEAGADFRMLENTSLILKCIGGPTPPQDSVIHVERKQREASHPGPVLWRLINLLALSHLGLTDRSAEDRAGGIKELLSLFSDISDNLTDRQVRGIDSVQSRPVVRRLRQPTGFNAARGIEITVTFDEKVFEGTGVMMLGAVLDRFFAEYTSLNSFTQTIIASVQRGVVMRWPPRAGMGGVL